MLCGEWVGGDGCWEEAGGALSWERKAWPGVCRANQIGRQSGQAGTFVLWTTFISRRPSVH